MPERKNPETSILAHESVKDSKEKMYVKITAALERLKIGGTSEEIAREANLDHDQVWKRLSEMRDKEKTVFDVGTTRKSSKGRASMIRQLVAFRNQQITLNLK
jgi:hypothetical protein